jgi:S1-C subfamily serine protease
MSNTFRLFSLVLLVLLTNCTTKTFTIQQVSIPSTKMSRSELMAKTGSSTVALVYRGQQATIKNDHLKIEELYKPYCTGVWVSNTKILTAYHCVNAMIEKANSELGEDDPKVDPIGLNMYYVLENEVSNVKEEPTAIHLGKSYALDKEHDLGMIEAQGKAIPKHMFTTVAEKPAEIGEHIFCVGHPVGLYWTYVEATVASYREKMNGGLDIEGPFLQVSAPIYFGNSGGGAFNDNGELLGISSFIMRAPNVAFYIHSDSIKAFLKAN